MRDALLYAWDAIGVAACAYVILDQLKIRHEAFRERNKEYLK